jgi:DNA (cytosine-5)-methyltransferase 1
MGAILNDNTKLIMLKSGKLRKISNQGVSGSIGLARTVAMYPTPSANEDAAGTPNGKMQKMLGNSPLIRGTTPEEWNGGTLNPTWVEWLMGWPLGSTDLKPLAMDKFLLWLNSHGKY